MARTIKGDGETSKGKGSKSSKTYDAAYGTLLKENGNFPLPLSTGRKPKPASNRSTSVNVGYSNKTEVAAGDQTVGGDGLTACNEDPVCIDQANYWLVGLENDGSRWPQYGVQDDSVLTLD